MDLTDNKISIWDLMDKYDEDDLIVVFPYMEAEFYNWLKNFRGIKDKYYLQKFVDGYESAYERIYNKVYVDIYETLRILFKHGNRNADFALDLFEIACVNVMKDMLDEDKNAFTQNEIRSIEAYRDFLASMTDNDNNYNNKNLEIPFVEDFKVWLETINMSYDNIVKVISSIKRSIVWYKYTSLYHKIPNPFITASKLETKEHRICLFNSIYDESKNINHISSIKKTIQNSISNIRLYFNFLNNYTKQ